MITSTHTIPLFRRRSLTTHLNNTFAFSRCSPISGDSEASLTPYAWARTSKSRHWSLALRFNDRDGRRHTVLVTHAQIAEGATFFARLEERGLSLPTSSVQRAQLTRELLAADPARRVLLVDRSGWHADQFLLGSRTVGSGPEPLMVIGEPDGDNLARIHRRGSLDDWKRQVAAPCCGSSYLISGICLGLAAPLLGLLQVLTSEIHFLAPDRATTETFLALIASIFGNGQLGGGYVRSAEEIRSAPTAVLAGHSDLPLVVDGLIVSTTNRLPEMDVPAYRPLSGIGLDPPGSPPPRSLLISAGELSIPGEPPVPQDTSSGRKPPSLIQVPLPRQMIGIFDRFPENDGECAMQRFAERLRENAGRYYGAAGRAFIERLVAEAAENKIKLAAQIKGYADSFLALSRIEVNDGGQFQRAQIFAVACAAGRLAIRYEILPWDRALLERSLVRCYRRALTRSVAPENAIGNAAARLIRRVRKTNHIVDLSAAQGVDRDLAESARVLLTTHSDGSRLLAVRPDFFRSIVGRDVAAPAVARHLEDEGVLLGRPNGRRTRQLRIPGSDKRRDYYCLKLDRVRRPKDQPRGKSN